MTIEFTWGSLKSWIFPFGSPPLPLGPNFGFEFLCFSSIDSGYGSWPIKNVWYYGTMVVNISTIILVLRISWYPWDWYDILNHLDICTCILYGNIWFGVIDELRKILGNSRHMFVALNQPQHLLDAKRINKLAIPHNNIKAEHNTSLQCAEY